ncbi:MAG: hypothetical protein IT531_12245 [Burkholderiales bacterium]|nr:hypothetical protein [Burkholderiales bacterium]
MSDSRHRLIVKPLHPLFVAEITGIDLLAPLARDDLQASWDAFNELPLGKTVVIPPSRAPLWGAPHNAGAALYGPEFTVLV